MHWPRSKAVQLKATRSRTQPAVRSTAFTTLAVEAGFPKGGCRPQRKCARGGRGREGEGAHLMPWRARYVICPKREKEEKKREVTPRRA